MRHPCGSDHIRAALAALLLALAPAMAATAADPPASSSAVDAAVRQGRWEELRRRALEEAVLLDPSSARTIGALAAAGATDAALAAARRSAPALRTTLLLSVAEQATQLPPRRRLDIVGEAGQSASAAGVLAQIGAGNAIAVALAYAHLGDDTEARQAWQRALAMAAATTPPVAASLVRRMAETSIGETTNATPEWLLAGLSREVTLLAAGADRGFAHLALAQAWRQRGAQAESLAQLEAAMSAGSSETRRADRQLVLKAAARIAVQWDMPEIALRQVDADALAIEFTAYHARHRDRALALKTLERIGSDGLYVSHRSSAMVAAVQETIARGDAGEAAFYIERFGELLPLTRVDLWVRLARLQAEQGARDSTARTLTQALAVIPDTPDPHASNRRDVATLLRLTRSLDELGRAAEARTAFAAAARQADYISLRRNDERAMSRIALARFCTARGDRRLAAAQLRQAWLEFHSPLATRPLPAVDHADVLLAFAEASGELAR